MAAAIIGGIVSLAPTAANYLSAPNAKDPARFAEAQGWYNAAINGDNDALCALQHMTGNFDCATCGKYGYRCGYATDVAKAYTMQLYSQAVSVLNGSLPKSAPMPAAPSATGQTSGTAQTIGQVSGTIADVSGAVATAFGNPTTQLGSPTQTRERIETAGWIAAALVVGVILYVALKRKG